MLGDGILIAKQSVTRKSKWSRNLHLSALVLTELDGWSEKPASINRLVMSRPSTHKIVPTVFFKLLLQETNTKLFYLKGAGRQFLRVYQVEKKRFGVPCAWYCSSPAVKGMWSTLSLPLLPGSLCPRMEVPVRVSFMAQMEVFNLLIRIIFDIWKHTAVCKLFEFDKAIW